MDSLAKIAQDIKAMAAARGVVIRRLSVKRERFERVRLALHDVKLLNRRLAGGKRLVARWNGTRLVVRTMEGLARNQESARRATALRVRMAQMHGPAECRVML